MAKSKSETKEPFLRSIKLTNILSFGESSEPIELRPLNVLIGPNGSGKSNLIEAIGLLRAASGDLQAGIREGGGIEAWLWEGGKKAPKHAGIEASIFLSGINAAVRHKLGFAKVGQRFELAFEAIHQAGKPGKSRGIEDYSYEMGQDATAQSKSNMGIYGTRFEAKTSERSFQSILSQLKDPTRFPVITGLGRQYSEIGMYRERYGGPLTQLREPQMADMPNFFLLDDASNLGMILIRLQSDTIVSGHHSREAENFLPSHQ